MKNKKRSFISGLILKIWKKAQKELLPIGESFIDSEGKYPFELFYDDGSRSWKPAPHHKRPWGIIVNSAAIRLRAAPKRYNWDEAQDYCSKICINGRVASCGSLASWKKVAELSPDEFLKLNHFLVFLKGDRLDNSPLWTTSSESFFRAYAIKLGENSSTLNQSKTFGINETRPVIEGI